ncbi:uncharacterized protein LOC143047071 [Mytilus galloprovincialis]|uniref:uncharacterized protein LOC143047071 n=1 Tax=Mytilus galloprovincialis TaxID=29158 RepID=UPI003F7BD238
MENKRSCKEYKCEILMNQSKSKSDLPKPETKGIFAIKENDCVIYVGQSQDCMRERILSHISGYDSQDIGEHLKNMDKEEKERSISISWVDIEKPRFEEHHYLKCIATRQAIWPKFNRKRGRPKKNSVLYM